MLVFNNIEIINNGSMLIVRFLLESQMGLVQQMHHCVPIVTVPERGPGIIVVEEINALSTAG